MAFAGGLIVGLVLGGLILWLARKADLVSFNVQEWRDGEKEEEGQGP